MRNDAQHIRLNQFQFIFQTIVQFVDHLFLDERQIAPFALSEDNPNRKTIARDRAVGGTERLSIFVLI